MLAKVEVALTFVGLYVRSCYRFGGNLHNIYMPLWIGFSWGKAQAENIATTHYLHKYSWESFPIALPGVLTCLHTAGEQLIHKTSACVNRDKVKTWALCFLGGCGLGGWTLWVTSQKCACLLLSNFDSVAANLICIAFIFRPASGYRADPTRTHLQGGLNSIIPIIP